MGINQTSTIYLSIPDFSPLSSTPLEQAVRRYKAFLFFASWLQCIGIYRGK